jgi:hypothetical protein
MDGRQRCLNLPDLKAALQRSRNASLDIKITDFSRAMARRLADEWERWGSLEIIGPYDINSQTDALNMLFGIHQRNIGLQSVILLPGLDNQLLYKWLETARPVSLHLNGCTDVTLNELSWWQELRELRLHNVGTNSVPRSLNIQSTLTATTHLTHLEILNHHDYTCPIDSTMHFPQLVKLYLKRVEGWWHFRCDKLLELKLELRLRHQPPPNSTFSYPNLRILDWDAYHDNLGAEMIAAPQLESLTLRRVKDAAPGINLIWLNHNETPSGISPKYLSLIEYWASSKALATSLRRCTALQDLRIEECTLYLSFFKAFTAKPTRKLPRPCYNLRNITVSLLTDAKFDKDQYTQVFKAFVAMRRGTKPLKSLRIQWPHRTRWEEFSGTAA